MGFTVHRHTGLLLAALLAASALLQGKCAEAVRLPAVISSGMVLQTNWENGNRAQLWGWAAPNELVTLKIGSTTWTAQAEPVAGPDGAIFKMQLNGMAELHGASATQGGAKNPGINMTFSGSSGGPNITVERVLVGEVFVCVGDHATAGSPMSAPLASRGTVAGNDTSVRLFVAGGRRSGWQTATPAQVAEFPALCYLPALQATDKHFRSARKSEDGGTRNLGIVLARAETMVALADWQAPFGAAYMQVLAPLRWLRFRSMIFAPAFATFEGNTTAGLLPATINSWRDAAKWGDFPVVGISSPPSVTAPRSVVQSMLPSSIVQTTGLAVASDLANCMHGGEDTITLTTRIAAEILHTTVGFACIGSAPTAQYGCSPRAMSAVATPAEVVVAFDLAGAQGLRVDPSAVIELRCGLARWTKAPITQVDNHSLILSVGAEHTSNCTEVRFISAPMAAIYSSGSTESPALRFPAYDFQLPVSATGALTLPRTAPSPVHMRRRDVARVASDREWASREQLDNGLALTPVLGWETWNAYHATFGERLIRQTVDAMVSSGMKAAGYEYVIFDEWTAKERDAEGKLQPDMRRFPSGVKALCDYIHQRGLLCGIYTTCGPQTCQRRAGSPPASAVLDANSFVAWGADYVFVDACGDMEFYENFARALNRTGHPVVIEAHGPVPSSHGAEIRRVTNLWRIEGDLQFNWESVLHEAQAATHLAPFSGPGGWNFLDMMEVGDPGLTVEEMRSHMALWSIIASPLLAGNLLQDMDNVTAAVLSSPGILAVNQDRLGRQGVLIGTLPSPVAPPGLRAYVVGAACNATDPAQLWSIEPTTKSLSSAAVGGCLTPHGCSEGAGDSLVVFDCVNKTCQDFQLSKGLLSVSGTHDCVAAGPTVHSPPVTAPCPQVATPPGALLWSMSAQTGGMLRANSPGGEYCLTVQPVPDGLQQHVENQGRTTAGAVWAKPLIDGSWAVALLNNNEYPSDVIVDFGDLNMTARTCAVRDLWTNTDLGSFSGSFVAKRVARHDTQVVQVSALP